MALPTDGQKIALVTGVGVGGIGGALVDELHKAGYFVICTARRESALAPFSDQGFAAVILDVLSTESVTAAAKQISSLTGGRLDVLINNAGSATHVPALDLDIDNTVSNMFDINVLGPMRMVKGFSGLLIKAKGQIVNIGSVAPILSLPFSSAYNSTKAALHSYGETLKIELAPLGSVSDCTSCIENTILTVHRVSVTTVVTGGVKSNLGQFSQSPTTNALTWSLVRNEAPELPANSVYLPVRDGWLKRVNASQSAPMLTEDYARGVVAMISKNNRPTTMWTGGSIIFSWIAYYLMPKSVKFGLLTRMFGLNKWATDKKVV